MKIVNNTKYQAVMQNTDFHLVFQHAAVGMALIDENGKFTYINNHVSEITGYPREELLQRTFQEITHPDDLEIDIKQAEALYRGEIDSYCMEKRYIRKDGTIVWIKLTGSAVFDEHGEFNTYVGVIEDISEKKNSEKALAEKQEQLSKNADALFESEKKLQLVLNNSHDGIHMVDLSTNKYVFMSPSQERLTGFTREELNFSLEEAATRLHPDDVSNVNKYLSAIIRGQQPIKPIEYRWRVKSGEYRWFSDSRKLVRNEQGEPAVLVGNSRDITDLKANEEALHAIEQYYKIASSAAKIGAYFRNLETGDDYWSPEFLALYGLEPDESLVMKDGIPAAIHSDDRENVLNLAQQHYKSSMEFSSDHRVILPDGTIRWVNMRGITERDVQKNPIKTYGVAMDITERKNLEEALVYKIEENKKLMDIIPAAIFVSEDPQCNYIKGNRMASKFYEADTDENVSANLNIVRRFFSNGKEQPPEELPMQKAARENKPIYNEVVDVLLPSGRWLYMHGSAIPLNDENGNVRGAVAAFVDVTKHIETEKELSESEEKFRVLADNMSQLAWMMDDKGWIFWYNKRWYDYTGTTFEEVQGWGWQKVHHPKHIERVLASLKKAINTGKNWKELFPLKSKMGKYHWFLTSAVPVKDNNGNVMRWLGTNTDVTQQRNYEKRLKRDTKLFEDLLYVAAHDLKGPVANIYGALDIMDRLPPEKKIMLLTKFKILADQLNGVILGITEILHLRNDDKSAASKINFEKLLNKVLLELNVSIEDVSIKYNFEKPEIKYIEFYLFSVIKNLVSNAVKYCREDVPPEIEISTKIKSGYILLSVRDNGIGIDMEKYGTKLFSPFQRFSTKKVIGTGVGLYLLKDIIEKNGGYITVESAPGKGTTFNCYLKEY